MPGRYWIACGAAFAALAVAAGALGTHFLKERLQLGQNLLESYETAARYQMYHALALILVGILLERQAHGLIQAAAVCFLVGILLFSGGIYGWVFTQIKPFVHIVPVGGITWILGWIMLTIGAVLATARTASSS